MPVDETVAETTAAQADDALPIALAAGLGLLALGGIGMALGSRRRRKVELAHMEANRAYLKTHPNIAEAHAPAVAGFATTAMASVGAGPAVKDVPRTKLPEGFDLSRFGPHVRAAYLGPTADNPSLSMKHRLRRAAAMDQQLRQHGEAPSEAVQRSVAKAKPAMKPLWDANDDSFMLRHAGTARTPKPALQH